MILAFNINFKNIDMICNTKHEMSSFISIKFEMEIIIYIVF